MPVTVTPIAGLAQHAFGVLRFKMAVVWCSTILGVAVATRASDNFVYEPIVLTVGFSLSWAVVESTARRFRREVATIETAPITAHEAVETAVSNRTESRDHEAV